MRHSQIQTEDCEATKARLEHMLAVHFDPKWGSPYWIEKARQLGLDARRDIGSIDDLALLGPMDAEALATRPIEDFIPRRFLDRRSELIFAETAGTLGRPQFAAHRVDEFEQAFVRPFVVAAEKIGFPHEANWLFVGPTGPHIIGKAATACAKALGSGDIFAVDFDPRWVKKLVEGSFARQRYLEHIEEQALRILGVQRIGVIFGTCAVMDSLAAKVPSDRRERIEGIHLGGMSASCDLLALLREKFPNAVILSGYGNTLFGMMPELPYSPETGIDYYPYGPRLIARVIENGDEDEGRRISKHVDYGLRGQVMIHRLDETQLIVNMCERDTAVRIQPLPEMVAEGFLSDGLRDPQPIVSTARKPSIGLY